VRLRFIGSYLRIVNPERQCDGARKHIFRTRYRVVDDEEPSWIELPSRTAGIAGFAENFDRPGA
jgi:hypothetical protein